MYLPGILLGVLGGLELFLRPNLVATVLSVILVLTVVCFSEKKWSAWLQLMAGALGGALVVGMAFISYLAFEGALVEFWDQVFRYNILYSAASWKLRMRAALWGLKGEMAYGSVLPFAGWLLALYKLLSRRRGDRLFAIYLLGIVWLPTELLFASISGREYAHYFVPLLPSLSFLSAVVATEFSQSLSGMAYNARHTVMAFSVALAIVPMLDTVLSIRDG
jgi:hypothetical protein